MQYDAVVLTEGRYLAADETCWYTRQIHHEDNLVADALRRRGFKVARLDWADPEFDWSETRSAVFRTTWDYFHRFAEFAPWLAKVGQATRLFNEAALIHWNLDKHYLGQLAEAGINIVPTRFIEVGDARTLAEAIADSGWTDVILKPAISGGARHTYRLKPEDTTAHEATFAELVAAEALMLQPFQRNITGEGELSLMVIDGHVTHAIRKTAKAGDFRVQDDWGGMVHPHEPDAEEIAFAEAAVAAVPFDVLYARVDAVRDNDGRLALMELEMVEPELFFRFHPEAADTLAEGLARRLAALSD
ncbi:ATP-grasp domain-containing protein [Crenobacter cavernae]|uniref:ATP-grasp fold RimK-type domain-containing protein n=1 Tax=Crenobacter cavernae TaxID=2290923 RepID=A0A345Y3A0_9NEIS|nr:hypothetical protein [Crenobacter cavernae]AXK38402.1 hypothetical protein DWG20_02585 [Crenobacter cavernae]